MAVRLKDVRWLYQRTLVKPELTPKNVLYVIDKIILYLEDQDRSNK